MRPIRYTVGDPTFTPTVHRIRASNLTIASDNFSSGATYGPYQVGMFLPDMRMQPALAAGVGAAYSIRFANGDTRWVDVAGEGGVNVIAELNVTEL